MFKLCFISIVIKKFSVIFILFFELRFNFAHLKTLSLLNKSSFNQTTFRQIVSSTSDIFETIQIQITFRQRPNGNFGIYHGISYLMVDKKVKILKNPNYEKIQKYFEEVLPTGLAIEYIGHIFQ